MDKATAYQILEINKEANDEDVKKAYVKLVRQHPPDIDPEAFIKVRKAYENLKNPAKRAKEDLFTFNPVLNDYQVPRSINLTFEQVNSEIMNLQNEMEMSSGDPLTQSQLVIAFKNRASLNLSRRSINECIMDWKRILQMDASDQESKSNLFNAYNSLAYGLAINERYDDALTYWGEALKIDLSNVDVIHNLAIIYDKKANKEESDKYWRDTLKGWNAQLKANPQDEYLKSCIVELHNFFGGRFIEAKPAMQPVPSSPADVEKAIEQYREALKVDPKNIQTQQQILNALMQSGNWSEVITEVTNMLRSNRENMDLMNLLGQAYLNIGKIDEAFSIWNRILSVDSKNQKAKTSVVEGHKLVGKKLRDRGLFNAALVHYKSLLKFHPDDPLVHLEIGNTYSQKGDFRSALASWQAVLQLDPKNKEAKKALSETRFR
jgi:tetratricopeptide (TPR) repeat protein